MLLDGGVNAGWTFYVPLSIMNYCSIDLMFFSLHILGLSSLLGSFNFIVTIFKASNLSIQYNILFLSSILSKNRRMIISFAYIKD